MSTLPYVRTYACAGKVKVHLEGGLGCVDVLPSPSTACIYITGEEVAANVSPATRTRLTALAKVYMLVYNIRYVLTQYSPQYEVL